VWWCGCDPQDLKAGLLEQITAKKQEELLEKQHALEQERRYLEHVRMEAEEQRLFSKMKQQVVKRDLMDSWNRDIRLKETLREKEMAGKLANRRASRQLGLSARAGGGVLPMAGDASPPPREAGGATNGLGAGLPPAPGSQNSGRGGGGSGSARRPSARGFAGTARSLPGGGGAYMSVRSGKSGR